MQIFKGARKGHGLMMAGVYIVSAFPIHGPVNLAKEHAMVRVISIKPLN